MSEKAARDEIEQAIERHGPWLLSWFRIRGASAEVAEDLAQEALLRLWRRRRSLREPGAAGAWLRTTARDLLRRHRARKSPRTLAHEPTAEPECAASRIELAEALAALPDELEEVLLVRFSRGLSYEEVAAALGLPRPTVQSRLRRALALLRERLEIDEEDGT